MPNLSEHQSAKITKLLLMGDSGTGKTGALISLVKDGYKLRVLDMDNGLDILVNLIRRECPDRLGNVSYQTYRDKRRATPMGPVIDGTPSAFVKAINALDKWPDDNSVPGEWGAEYILVVDSLTLLSNAAMDWSEAFKVTRGKDGKADGRAIYFEAQKALENMLALLTSESFGANVIVISHINYIDMDAGTKKGFPLTAGQALSPKIPAYFNSIALCERSGGAIKPTIRTVSTTMIDLKNPASFSMAASLPVDTALADFFRTVRGGK